MENVNVNNTDMEFNEEEVRAQIEADILLELETQNIRVVPNKFHFQDSLKDIVLRYDKATADLKAYKEEVYSQYLPHVAETLYKAEKDSYEESRLDFIKDIDKISEFDKEYKFNKINEALNSEEYKTIKADIFRDLSYLKGCKDIPYDLVADITNEMIAHYDIKGLRIAEVMLGSKNTEAGRLLGNNVGKLRNELTLLNEDNHLVKEVKQYFATGQETYSIFALKNEID